MSAIDKVRSFAESREPDVAVIRDGITYGDARVLLEEVGRLRAALTDAEERASQNRLSAEADVLDRCVHCGVELEVEGDAGHCLSCTRGGK